MSSDGLVKFWQVGDGVRDRETGRRGRVRQVLASGAALAVAWEDGEGGRVLERTVVPAKLAEPDDESERRET